MYCHPERSEPAHSHDQPHSSFVPRTMAGSLLSCVLLAVCIVLTATGGSAQEKKTAAEITVAAAADLSTALKQARFMALLPYTAEHIRGM